MAVTWLEDFPALGAEQLSALHRFIDDAFRAFTREHGQTMELLFEPLRQFLLASERLLTQTPWPVVMGLIAVIAWRASRSCKVVLGAVLPLLLIGWFGMWENTMKTISMIVVSTVVSLVLGLPIGMLMSRWERLRRIVNPVLDVMQTMPGFVYLIPVVMLLGIGRVPGLIAVVIYAIAPVIRFTSLGIRLVDKDVLEAADAFGSSAWKKMWRVQLPLALPTIMGGVNQTIMMALSMVIVASMIGVPGLGQPVLKAISNQYFTMGMLNGMAIVAVAIVFDRISQAYGKRLQRHLEVRHG